MMREKCDCSEATLEDEAGRRMPLPPPDLHSCEYVRRRNALIPLAVKATDLAFPKPVKSKSENEAEWEKIHGKWADKWNLEFSRHMKRLWEKERKNGGRAS